MMTNTLMLIPMLLVSLAGFVLTIYLVVLLIKALRKYLRSGEVRKEKSQLAKSLGEILKEERLRCQMTQEFVAESLGVSRQAVSKWESGASDPSLQPAGAGQALRRLGGRPAAGRAPVGRITEQNQ